MQVLKVEILNPKATKVLKKLEEDKLISISEKEEVDSSFFKTISKIRSRTKGKLSQKDILKELQEARKELYDELS